jgi:hypothetical protein
MRDPFFEGLDWEKGMRLEISPPAFHEFPNEYEPDFFA